jgi:hypothetical protein
MRFASPIAIACLAAALLAGCGGSSGGGSEASTSGSGGGQKTESSGEGKAPAGASAQACLLDTAAATGLRVTAVSCGEGQKVVLTWLGTPGCPPPAGATRSGCTVRHYRCLGYLAEQGLSVDCSRPGRSIAFIAKE